MIRKEFKDAIIEFSKWKQDLMGELWRIYVFFDDLRTYREVKNRLKGKVIVEEVRPFDIRKLLKGKKYFISLFLRRNASYKENNK